MGMPGKTIGGLPPAAGTSNPKRSWILLPPDPLQVSSHLRIPSNRVQRVQFSCQGRFGIKSVKLSVAGGAQLSCRAEATALGARNQMMYGEPRGFSQA